MLTGQSLSLLHDFCLANNPRKEDDSLMGPNSDTRLGAEPVMQQPDQSLFLWATVLGKWQCIRSAGMCKGKPDMVPRSSHWLASESLHSSWSCLRDSEEVQKEAWVREVVQGGG